MEHRQDDVPMASTPREAVRVNGVPLGDAAIAEERVHYQGEADPDGAVRRALVIRELLRQRAVALGMLGEEMPFDDAASDALLAREVTVPEPTRADCEHYYRQHTARFRRNDIVCASHILFAVTNRSPLARVRAKAEETLQQVRAAPDTFEAAARDLSNCPSAAVGGSLGQLLRGASAPEFERALFDTAALGILLQLVNTRFGFHVVRVERRVDGDVQPFDEVEASIAAFLDTRVRHKAMQQYVTVLAGQACVEGVDFGGFTGPLVQ